MPSGRNSRRTFGARAACGSAPWRWTTGEPLGCRGGGDEGQGGRWECATGWTRWLCESRRAPHHAAPCSPDLPSLSPAAMCPSGSSMLRWRCGTGSSTTHATCGTALVGGPACGRRFCSGFLWTTFRKNLRVAGVDSGGCQTQSAPVCGSLAPLRRPPGLRSLCATGGHVLDSGCAGRAVAPCTPCAPSPSLAAAVSLLPRIDQLWYKVGWAAVAAGAEGDAGG